MEWLKRDRYKYKVVWKDEYGKEYVYYGELI